jgi:ATP/maltotriose-dependent transcriptional regulator MalT
VVQQCLCVLGGLSMAQGEVQQAQDMLKNARILAKNLGDPATQMLVHKSRHTSDHFFL